MKQKLHFNTKKTQKLHYNTKKTSRRNRHYTTTPRRPISETDTTLQHQEYSSAKQTLHYNTKKTSQRNRHYTTTPRRLAGETDTTLQHQEVRTRQRNRHYTLQHQEDPSTKQTRVHFNTVSSCCLHANQATTRAASCKYDNDLTNSLPADKRWERGYLSLIHI